MPDRRIDEQIAIIRKGSVSLETEDDLRVRLREGKPLRVKYGADPSAPDIHLGHTVVLNKLRAFQELGHEIIFIIGDFTARIGDPSGRVKTRPQLTKEEVDRNAHTYTKQVFKVLHPSKTEMFFNSEWLERLGFADIIRIASRVTVAQMLQRDDYAQRYSRGVPISLHEFLYPLAQAYDSIHVRADVEIGGTDQTFNLLLGRELQRSYGQPPQVIMTMPLLEGIDGVEKMSKSLGNCIGITEPPHEIFGKVMSISDDLMERYYELLTDYDYRSMAAEVPHPKDRKMRLAREIVERFHGAAAADSAQANFILAFSGKGVPEWVREVKVPAGEHKLVWLMKECGLVPSGSEARRKIQEGAVEIDDRRVTDIKETLTVKDSATIIRVGKKQFARVVPRK